MGGRSARLQALLGESAPVEEEQPATGRSERLTALLGGGSALAEPEQAQAPAQPQGEDELEQSILGAILDTAGDFAGKMFNGRAQQYDLPERAENPGQLLLGGGLKGGTSLLSKLGASLGNAGIEAGVSGVQGAAEGFDKSDEASILGRILDAGRSAGVDGGTSGGLSLVADLAGKATGGVGKAASWLARKADNTKAGSTSRIREDLIEKFGIEDGPDKLGELLRHYSPSGLFSPKTSADHLATIEKQLADEGTNLRAMTRQAGEEGADAAAPVAMEGAHDAMLGKAAELDAAARGDSAAAEAERLEMLLNRSASKPLPGTFEQLIGAKSQYADDAFRPVTGFAEEDAKSQAAKQAWMAVKDAEQQALAGVSDDTFQRFDDAQGTFSELSALNDSLRPRASADDAVGNVGSSAVSAAAASMVDPSMGILASLMSGTNNAVRQATSGIAHDVFSNVMHPTGAALQGVGGAASNMSRPLGRIAGDQAEEQSRGHQLTQGVRGALQSDPSVFGEFAQQLQEAEQNGDLSTKVGALIEDEPKFRALLARMRRGG